jgi:uncharacterized protein (TIGR02145 family)
MLLSLVAIILLMASCSKSDLVSPSPGNIPIKGESVTTATPGAPVTLLPAETATDIDGNVYHTVIIGEQTWMVENLKTTKYRDGTPIPNVTNIISWNQLTTGAYVNYFNNPQHVAVYGRSYNWYAVNDARKIAPIGWHVPTKDEWAVLVNHLGGEAEAGGRLKESGTSHWMSPNPTTINNNNENFNALPGGWWPSSVNTVGMMGIYWSSTSISSLGAATCDLLYNNKRANLGGHSPKEGLSVRCIKNAASYIPPNTH